MTPSTVNEDGELVPINTNFATPNNRDWRAESFATALYCKDESKTQQHLAEETDINTIVNRFMKTGQIPEVRTPPAYQDLTTQEDYHTYLNRIANINGEFYKLPAAIRASYQNDPGQWLQDVNERIAAGDLEPLREMGMQLPEKAPTVPGGTPPSGDTPAPETPKTA